MVYQKLAVARCGGNIDIPEVDISEEKLYKNYETKKKENHQRGENFFFPRDLSWLVFEELVSTGLDIGEVLFFYTALCVPSRVVANQIA